ncbi:hypothetical protein DVH24_002504 [Malus domestica]|uniref:Uncharacterized protein n=1 Tax=Malus domestica TaxID=3750 RepID=A0A498IPY3_MALDO|nr:hypothetical protein DVH24_002504 [Malus domestica]
MGPVPFNQHGTNDLPVKPTQPQRAASLTRFREKRKERCFDKRICYTQVRVSVVIIDLKDDSINGEMQCKKVNLHHPRLVLMMNVVLRFGSFGKEVSHQVIEFESPASSGATHGSVQDGSIQETLFKAFVIFQNSPQNLSSSINLVHKLQSGKDLRIPRYTDNVMVLTA